ncbi:MAG: type III-B CRISPR module-associated protein Cmr5 [Candidatus Competibacteraceae bacterium]
MATTTQANQPTLGPTREQQRAQQAYERVKNYSGDKREADYQRFCKRFPALIQSCGLAQSVAFAQAKLPEYLEDLAKVIDQSWNKDKLAEQARTAPLLQYQQHTQAALSAATWLKRYAEALLAGEINDSRPG